MASFWDNLSLKYKQGTVVTRLMFINIAVFILLRVIFVVLSLFKWSGSDFIAFFQMPSDLKRLLQEPWTVFTYMFVHLDLLHILFNMLWLYFFGSMFLRWFRASQLVFVYIIGGLFGALFFSLFYNILPAFQGHDAQLMGASASILALGIAVAIYRPDEPVPLLIFGTIRLKWLAIVLVGFDVLNLNGENAGGNLAHIGGAVGGLLFGLLLRNNLDVLRFVEPLFQNIKRIFRPRPKMKITYQRPKNETANRTTDVDQEYRDRKKADDMMLDDILDKIKRSGYDSLTSKEKTFLFDSSRNH